MEDWANYVPVPGPRHRSTVYVSIDENRISVNIESSEDLIFAVQKGVPKLALELELAQILVLGLAEYKPTHIWCRIANDFIYQEAGPRRMLTQFLTSISAFCVSLTISVANEYPTDEQIDMDPLPLSVSHLAEVLSVFDKKDNILEELIFEYCDLLGETEELAKVLCRFRHLKKVEFSYIDCQPRDLPLESTSHPLARAVAELPRLKEAYFGCMGSSIPFNMMAIVLTNQSLESIKWGGNIPHSDTHNPQHQEAFQNFCQAIRASTSLKKFEMKRFTGRLSNKEFYHIVDATVGNGNSNILELHLEAGSQTSLDKLIETMKHNSNNKIQKFKIYRSCNGGLDCYSVLSEQTFDNLLEVVQTNNQIQDFDVAGGPLRTAPPIQRRVIQPQPRIQTPTDGPTWLECNSWTQECQKKILSICLHIELNRRFPMTSIRTDQQFTSHNLLHQLERCFNGDASRYDGNPWRSFSYHHCSSDISTWFRDGWVNLELSHAYLLLQMKLDLWVPPLPLT